MACDDRNAYIEAELTSCVAAKGGRDYAKKTEDEKPTAAETAAATQAKAITCTGARP